MCFKYFRDIQITRGHNVRVAIHSCCVCETQVFQWRDISRPFEEYFKGKHNTKNLETVSYISKNSLRLIFLCSKTYLNLQEVRKYLKECIQIFSFEPTCIQEGRLAAIARLDLVELETFVDSVEKTSSVAAVEGMAYLS